MTAWIGSFWGRSRPWSRRFLDMSANEGLQWHIRATIEKGAILERRREKQPVRSRQSLQRCGSADSGHDRAASPRGAPGRVRRDHGAPGEIGETVQAAFPAVAQG